MIKNNDECKKTIRFLISSEHDNQFVVEAPGDTPLYLLIKLCNFFTYYFWDLYYFLPICGSFYEKTATDIIIGDDFIKCNSKVFAYDKRLSKYFCLYSKEDPGFFYLDSYFMELK